MRELSDKFMQDLLNAEGILRPVLERMKKDHTLMLAIRDRYINIYYRGGNILRVKEHNKGFYQPSFDEKYNLSEQCIQQLPDTIENQEHAAKCVALLPQYKSIMDEYFAAYGKA